jgi:hypothetical protein
VTKDLVHLGHEFHGFWNFAPKMVLAFPKPSFLKILAPWTSHRLKEFVSIYDSQSGSKKF